MKKMLATAMAFAAVASAALAQQADQGQSVERISIPFPAASTVKAPHIGPASVQEESAFGWWTNILRRFGEDGDTNRVDITIPIKIPTNPQRTQFVEMRGMGQIFAPRYLYGFFSGSVYNENSGIIQFEDPALTDQDYIDQFKNAKDFQLDSVRLSVFKNPHGLVPDSSGRIVIYKTTTNFNSSTYKNNGLKNISRHNTLEKNKLFEREMTPDDLEATVNSEQGLVNPTTLTFDPPLQFAENESAIVMYQNLGAPAQDQPVADDAEVQRMIGTLEYREGGGNAQDTLHNPIEPYKSFGVLLVRNGKADSLWSAAQFLSFGNLAAVWDASMNFFGRVNLVSGVNYEFGKAAAAQGLGSVSPNPVSKDALVPFALAKASKVRIDLFDMNGKLVRTLHDGPEVLLPANYSANLSIDGLSNGAYMVRMVAGDKVYSTQVNVVR